MVTKELVTELKIPAIADYLGSVRLTISGIVSKMNFTAEAIEDIKVAVSEACTNVIQYAYPKTRKDRFIYLTLKQKPKSLEIVVKDTGRGFDVKNPYEKKYKDVIHMGLGLVFMKNLMDKAEIVSQKGKGTTVTLVKKVKK